MLVLEMKDGTNPRSQIFLFVSRGWCYMTIWLVRDIGQLTHLSLNSITHFTGEKMNPLRMLLFICFLAPTIFFDSYCYANLNNDQKKEIEKRWQKETDPDGKLKFTLDNSGPTICPFRKTVFEIDDRGECVFVDTNSLKMPMYGQVCGACGLIQQDKRDSCVWCGTGFSRLIQ